MKTIQTRIDEHVDAFVGTLQQLVREVAVEALQRRLGAPRGAKRRRQTSSRRSTEEIGALTEALYEAICAQPGELMATIGQAISRGPRELALCAHRLIAAGRVRKTGQRQHTRYFPVDAPAPRSRRTKRRR